MSNPTLAVADLQSNLVIETPSGASAFTGVDPIHFADGLLLQQATKNAVYNPIAATGTTSITAGAANTPITRVTTLPGPLPEPFAALVTTGIRVDITGAVTSTSPLVYFVNTISDISGLHQNQVYLWLPGSFTAPQIRLSTASFTGGGFSQHEGMADMALRDQWQVVTADMTLDAGDLQGALMVALTGGAATTGDYIYVTLAGAEPGAVRTSPAVGSFGGGYAWVGTPHNSPSTRAASSASLSPAGILSPSSGALAFRITPTIETGVEEIWGEVGAKGSGTDHIQWGRDASKHPFVEWSSNDAAYQRLTGSETLNALTAYDLYLGHSATTISLAVDAGTLQTGTRDAVSASWGAGNLTLEASAGGVIYQPFATFDRTLTAKEIATLNGKNNWTMKVLAGNPYTNFQLRPY